jgi:hypothetical protein
MEVGVANVTDEMLIGELLEKWATVTHFGNNYEVPANLASDFTNFDEAPPSSMMERTLTDKAGMSGSRPPKGRDYSKTCNGSAR